MLEVQIVFYKVASELFEKRFVFTDYYDDDLRKRTTFMNEDTLERLTLNWERTDYILTRPLNDFEGETYNN